MSDEDTTATVSLEYTGVEPCMLIRTDQEQMSAPVSKYWPKWNLHHTDELRSAYGGSRSCAEEGKQFLRDDERRVGGCTTCSRPRSGDKPRDLMKLGAQHGFAVDNDAVVAGDIDQLRTPRYAG